MDYYFREVGSKTNGKNIGDDNGGTGVFLAAIILLRPRVLRYFLPQELL